MAGYMNKVMLLGNLGADPELRTFQNGGRALTFNIATGESWTDRNSGERREKTTWTRVVIFADGLTDVAEKYLRKGSKVMIEGKLENREWTDAQDIKRYTTEVTLRPFHGELVLLGDAPTGERGERGAGTRRAPADRREPATANAGAGSSSTPWANGADDQDSDIPF